LTLFPFHVGPGNKAGLADNCAAGVSEDGPQLDDDHVKKSEVYT